VVRSVHFMGYWVNLPFNMGVFPPFLFSISICAQGGPLSILAGELVYLRLGAFLFFFVSPMLVLVLSRGLAIFLPLGGLQAVSQLLFVHLRCHFIYAFVATQKCSLSESVGMLVVFISLDIIISYYIAPTFRLYHRKHVFKRTPIVLSK
jgi:hypothetical protein